MADKKPTSRRRSGSCSTCGKGIQRRDSSAAVQICRECRGKIHGEYAYRHGCRCETCRGAVAAKNREYARRYRERTGLSLRRQFPDGSIAHWITDARRLAIYERDSWTCWICESEVNRDAHENADDAPSLDHVVPRSLGGGHASSNLRCAHRLCNSRRGAAIEQGESWLNSTTSSGLSE